MSDSEQEGIDTVPLFVGLTRPTSLFGLPLNAFVFNMMFVAILFLMSKNILLIAVGLPTHFILKFLTDKDAHIFDNIRLQGLTKGRCQNKYFGAVSFSPLGIRKIKSHRDYEEL